VQVPFVVSANYRLDSSGNWESSRKFDDATALYGLEMLSYEDTNAGFANMMNNISTQFKKVGDKGKYRDLSWNLIAHSTYSVVDRNHGLIEMFPEGDIVVMLNKEYREVGMAATKEGVNASGCSKNTIITIDQGSSSIIASFKVADQTDECKDFANTLGYLEQYGETFDYVLDLRSFATATAVNYGILTSKQLVEIKDNPNTGYQYDDDTTASGYGYSYGEADAPVDDTVEVSGDIKAARNRRKRRALTQNVAKIAGGVGGEVESDFEFEVAATATPSASEFKRFYDPKYDGMNSIACIVFDKDRSKSICFYQFELAAGTVYGYPVVRHFENTNCSDASQWGSSWYASDPTKNGEWTKTYDHTVDVFLGLIIFKNSSEAIDFAKEAWSYLSRPDGNGDLVLPDRLFPQMQALYQNDPETFEISEICGKHTVTSQVRDCFLTMFDVYGPNYYITSNNYQIFAGACRNSLWVEQAFKGAKKPPSDLVEVYYECVLEPYDAAFNAVGLSLGNADLISRYFFFVVMTVFVGLMVHYGGFETHLTEFTSKEEEDAEKSSAPTVTTKNVLLSEPQGKKRSNSDDDL
jgi:hypothetical protein